MVAGERRERPDHARLVLVRLEVRDGDERWVRVALGPRGCRVRARMDHPNSRERPCELFDSPPRDLAVRDHGVGRLKHARDRGAPARGSSGGVGEVSAMHGHDERQAASTRREPPKDGVAGGYRVVGVNQLERSFGPKPVERAGERSRRPATPGRVAHRPRRRHEAHVANVHAVEARVGGRVPYATEPFAKQAPVQAPQRAQRRQRPLERKRPNVGAQSVHPRCLAVRPDTQGWVGGPRIVLRDDGEAEGGHSLASAAWAAATRAVGTRYGEQLT